MKEILVKRINDSMRNLILIVLTFIGFSAISQNGNKAKSLLDEVAQKVEAYDNIYIEFDHKFDNTGKSEEKDIGLQLDSH